MDNSIKRENDGVILRRLKELFNIAQRLDDELAYIAGDTDLNKRMKAIEEYRHGVSNFMCQYSQIKEQLLLRADPEKLLNFIVEWSIFDPSILIGLAKTLNLYQSFSNVPERMRRRG